ncbi:hypothetical protein EMPS_07249 [Entomortierella parvispora]|uniref:F-box domain-containing protein n=1 Tax=Entomortierella parvispora TaxID=205924 RepID=A0A9P3LY04_9FUNG|nr:hypothetical protein EMPS_07249 [Entomortierella parvispora]
MFAGVSNSATNSAAHQPACSVNEEPPAIAVTSQGSENSLPSQGRDQDSDQRHCMDLSNPRRSIFDIPEILQEVCGYLHGLTLVRASRVSKDFFNCCKALLWTTIPESAWQDPYFCENWHHHGSRIRSLRCGPGVDLGQVALYCHNLVSLDVSRILDEQMYTPSSLSGASATDQNRVGSLSAAKSTASKNIISNTTQSDTKDTRYTNNSCSYQAFVGMTDNLVRVLESNRGLRCLQLKPLGRFPPALLEALTRLDLLEVLSLNGWQGFQEYSLQLILAGCRRLAHLSLGENDFTRFTLDTLACQDSSSFRKDEDCVIKLEPFDDPIKGTHGRHYVDQDLLDIQSKRAVRYPKSVPSLRSGQHLEILKPPAAAPFSNLASNADQPLDIQSRIRTLLLHQTGLRQEFLVNLTRQCPQLEHLSLINGWGFYPSSKFASVLAQLCPQLSRLEFREQALDLQDEFFVSLCRHFPRLQWLHAGRTGFSQSALESVGTYCRSIVRLNLDGTRGIQSPTLDGVLRSCPSLTELHAQGVVLNGRDLSKSSQWACTGLETLVLDIEIYVALPSAGSEDNDPAESVKTVRSRVYSQLAALTRLQRLGLGGGHRVGGRDSGVDLTLESGLRALTTLQCLESIDLRRLVQHLEQDDVEWMIQNWPRLEKVEVKDGIKNPRLGRHNKAIQWLAQARPGIELCI